MNDNNGWYPKETAPKDGSTFLAWVINGRWDSPVEMGYWHSFVGGGNFADRHEGNPINFEWWRPLPEGPVV